MTLEITFVRGRLGGLVEMLEDSARDVPAGECGRIIHALGYFVAADNVIPYATLALRLLDDAITAELLLRATRHEIDAYHEFSHYRIAGTRYRSGAATTANCLPTVALDVFR